MGDRLNDQFKPGMTSLNGVPLPYAGWVEQMTRLRAFGCAGAASVSAVLRQPAGPEREHRVVALQLTAGQAREALLGRLLRARLLHAVEDDFERGRTTRSAMRSRGVAFRV